MGVGTGMAMGAGMGVGVGMGMGMGTKTKTGMNAGQQASTGRFLLKMTLIVATHGTYPFFIQVFPSFSFKLIINVIAH